MLLDTSFPVNCYNPIPCFERIMPNILPKDQDFFAIQPYWFLNMAMTILPFIMLAYILGAIAFCYMALKWVEHWDYLPADLDEAKHDYEDLATLLGGWTTKT